MAQQQPGTQATATEVSVMQSRSVLEPVIRQFQFDVEIAPHNFPILGRFAEQLAYPGHPAKPWFGLSSFAWGGEQLKIPSLNVPAYLEEKPLVLTALSEGQYELRTPNGDLLLHGETGKPASTPDKNGRLTVHTDGRDPEIDGESLLLPRRERDILDYLARNRGRPVTKGQIFKAVYGDLDTAVDESVVEGHISKLRKKLRMRLGYDPIEAKRMAGYTFVG